MPCIDAETSRAWSEADECEKRYGVNELRDKIDKLTDMLCSIGKKIDAYSISYSCLPTEFTNWWVEHKAADLRRIAQEKRIEAMRQADEEAKKKALAKLDNNDKRALGYFSSVVSR